MRRVWRTVPSFRGAGEVGGRAAASGLAKLAAQGLVLPLLLALLLLFAAPGSGGSSPGNPEHWPGSLVFC
jgi:hypothetical protein